MQMCRCENVQMGCALINECLDLLITHVTSKPE